MHRLIMKKNSPIILFYAFDFKIGSHLNLPPSRISWREKQVLEGASASVSQFGQQSNAAQFRAGVSSDGVSAGLVAKVASNRVLKRSTLFVLFRDWLHSPCDRLSRSSECCSLTDG